MSEWFSANYIWLSVIGPPVAFGITFALLIAVDNWRRRRRQRDE